MPWRRSPQIQKVGGYHSSDQETRQAEPGRHRQLKGAADAVAAGAPPRQTGAEGHQHPSGHGGGDAQDGRLAEPFDPQAGSQRPVSSPPVAAAMNAPMTTPMTSMTSQSTTGGCLSK